jgi:PAS domain S-box-containing protein
VSAIRDAEGRPQSSLAVVVDITERKRAEEALRESELRLQKAMQIETVGVIFFTLEGQITEANAEFLRMSGYTHGDVAAGLLRWERLTPPEWGAQTRRAIEELQSSGRISPYEEEYCRRDGTRWWALITATKLSANEAVAFVLDITASKTATAERVAMGREVAVLAERNRMARELHDTLAHCFTGIKMQLDVADSALTEEPEEARRHIERAREISRMSLLETRRSVQALFEPALEHENLGSALARLTERVADGSAVRLITTGTPHSMPPDVANDLYRIGQEALTNALRHGRAKGITLRLTQNADLLRLEIEDDGCGFEPDASHQGLGLLGMRERAARIGAELSIASQPGRGTVVAVTLKRPPEQI